MCRCVQNPYVQNENLNFSNNSPTNCKIAISAILLNEYNVMNIFDISNSITKLIGTYCNQLIMEAF